MKLKGKSNFIGKEVKNHRMFVLLKMGEGMFRWEERDEINLGSKNNPKSSEVVKICLVPIDMDEMEIRKRLGVSGW